MTSPAISVCVPSSSLNQENESALLRSVDDSAPPVETVLTPPSLMARYTCLSILMGIFAVWGKLTLVDESQIPGAQAKLHHWSVTLGLTTFYLLSLPLLRMFSTRYLENKINVKVLLRESMVLYNAAQVVLNLWMVCRILHALVMRGHPFISGPFDLVNTGATYAVWVHYCDKYLEFFDTYFMVLRGRMDQVRNARDGMQICSDSSWGDSNPWRLSFYKTVPIGFVPSRISPFFDCMGLVARSGTTFGR